MDAIFNELSNLLVPLVASAILAGLKFAGPKIRDRVPNFLWPIAVFGLARAGTALCDALNAPCEGNPLNWDPDTVQTLAVVAVAGVIQQVAKAGKPALDALRDRLAKLAEGLKS